MPNGDRSVISGTVIERSFVANDMATILFAATVPLNEVSVTGDHEDGDFLRRTLAQITGVPANIIIDEEQYSRMVYELSARVLYREAVHELYEEELIGQRSAIRGFTEHAIALFASNGSIGDFRFPLDLPPWRPRTRPLERTVFENFDIDEDAARVGLACFNARLTRSTKVGAFTEGVLQYELPFGQSPATSSDSLLKLLESGKKMCLAPIVAGGTYGVAQLGQGQYVAALLSAGTGTVMTLVLLSGIAVGSLLINYVAQHRAARRGSDSPDRRVR